MALALAAARRKLPPIDQPTQSDELQRLSEAVGRASRVFSEVDQAFQRATAGQEHPEREALWRRAAEFRQIVDEVRSHAAAIHDEERRRSARRWAAVRDLLDHEAGHPEAGHHPPPHGADGGSPEVARELEGALAAAEERFKAAQQAFTDLRAAHQAGEPGDLEGWRARVADFRTAMAEVHELTDALRHPPPRPGG